MAKEVKMYEADDGKLYKTKSGAENWNKKLSVKSKLDELKMTEEEVQSKLEKLGERNKKISMLLTQVGPWTTWPTHLIKDINPKLWDESVKTTRFVREYRDWGKLKEEKLFVEKGPEFADPELHVNDQWKVVKVEDVDSITKKVYYDNKYTRDEVIQMKLEKGEKLSMDEVEDIRMYFNEVYKDVGENRRWSRSVTSVYEIGDKLYSVDWDEALTESQENFYYDQPYEVTLEEKEVTITKIVIEPVGEEKE